jgi:hypothetical protein
LTRLLDKSVLLASLNEAELHHDVCAALLGQGGHIVYVHALAEAFSTLTGGGQGLRLAADLAVRLLRDSVMPFVKTVGLSERDILAALGESQSRGVRVAQSTTTCIWWLHAKPVRTLWRRWIIAPFRPWYGPAIRGSKRLDRPSTTARASVIAIGAVVSG